LEKTGSLESEPAKERGGKTNKGELLRPLADRPGGWRLREFAERFNVRPQAAQKMFETLRLLHVKETYAYSEKPKKDREEFLKQTAKTPEEERVYAAFIGINARLQRECSPRFARKKS
jgi:hypothetical protein